LDILKDITAAVDRLKPLSPGALQLLSMVSGGEYGIQDVAHVVERDPALTANVLRVVNAPAFGLGVPVNSVARAVGYLGDRMVAGIALATSSPRVFNVTLAGYESGPGELWRHCLRTAIAARYMAVSGTNGVNANLAFTAGILHDIGKAVLSDYLVGRTPELLALIEARAAESFQEAERAVLGVDHCQVGHALALKWNLPEPIPQAVLLHHQPAKADPEWRELVFSVHLGDMVSMMGGTGTGVDTLMYPLDEGYVEVFDFAEEQLDQILLDVTMEFEKLRTPFWD
jgi:putative nucleotidyltransferase with HDIG domain